MGTCRSSFVSVAPVHLPHAADANLGAVLIVAEGVLGERDISTSDPGGESHGVHQSFHGHIAAKIAR